MEFTIEDVAKELGAKLGDPQTRNISDRTINETLEILMPALGKDEMELTDFVNLSIPIFKSLEGNARKVISDKIKEYEIAHPHPQQQSNSKPANQPESKDDKPQWVKDLEEFKSKVEAREDKENREKVNSKVKDILKNMGADEFMQDVAVKFTDIDYTQPVEAIAEQCKATYNAQNSRRIQNTGFPFVGERTTTPASPVTADERKAAVEENRKKFRSKAV